MTAWVVGKVDTEAGDSSAALAAGGADEGGVALVLDLLQGLWRQHHRHRLAVADDRHGVALPRRRLQRLVEGGAIRPGQDQGRILTKSRRCANVKVLFPLPLWVSERSAQRTVRQLLVELSADGWARDCGFG